MNAGIVLLTQPCRGGYVPSRCVSCWNKSNDVYFGLMV